VDIIQQFDGINYRDPYNTNGVPPDPHGAVGPGGILASVNTVLAYYPKRGDTNRTAIWKAPLSLRGRGTNAPSFWAPNPGFGGAGTAGGEFADTKEVYDPDLQRFFVIMQENPGDQSFLNVAVSRNSDPRTPTTADWFFYRWNVTERWTIPNPLDPGGTLMEVEVGIDYPGIAVDRRVLVLSFNTFTLDEVSGVSGGTKVGAKVLVFDKRKLAFGLGDTPRVWNSPRPFGLPLNLDVTLTLQPAQPIGDADPGNRILLVELRLKLDDPIPEALLADEWCLRLHVLDDPLGRFEHDHDDIDIDRPGNRQDWLRSDLGAPQPGNAIRLDTLAKRCMNAIFFDGKVWTVYTQPPDEPATYHDPTVIHWAAIEPRVGESVLAGDGYFNNSGTGGWLYMPAIGATPRGDMCIVYTESGPNLVPTMKARVRHKDDPAWGNELTIKTSANAAVANPKPGEVFARWGDYAAVVPDPVDGSLWVTHEYVNSTDNNDWSTTWAQLAGCHFPVAGDPQDASASNCATPASFSAGAWDLFGDPLPSTTAGYQWRRNGVSLTNASRYRVTTNLTSSTLDVLAPGFADEGWYDVVVTNACGAGYATVSQPALLTMNTLPTWATIDAGPQPLNRIGHRMVNLNPREVYRDITVLFGGEVSHPSRGLFITNDLWIWAGNYGWYPVDQVNPPPPRTQHAMACDAKRGVLVLFGGYYSDPKTNIVYRDTWEWDGWRWEQRFPTNSPPARYNHAMAYDSVRGETLLIGGNLDVPEINHTWAWDGTSWFLRSTNVPPRLTSTYLGSYSLYNGNAMAFDERNGAAVLFGPFGTSADRVWEWAGNWFSRDPSSVSSGVMDSRGGCAFYDSYRGMVGFVMPGGSPYIYYWRPAGGASPNRYLRFDPMMDGAPGSLPWRAQVVYDAANRVLLAFGGGNFNTEPPRTRVLAFSDDPVVFQQPAATNLLPGQVLTLHAAVTGGGCGPLYYTWYHNGQVMATSARVTGLGTPTLGINSVRGSDSGTYQLVVSGTVNGTNADFPTTPVRIGVGPALHWELTGNILHLHWTGPTVVLEEAPQVTGPWTPHPELSSPVDVSTVDGGMKFYRLSMPE
jgi:hypothetical protein